MEKTMQLSNDFLNQTLALPAAERAALAHRLLLSLTPPEADDDPAIWEQELAARLDAVESGNYAARDRSEAMAAMRQALAERRKP